MKLGDLRICAKALSESEIKETYNETSDQTQVDDSANSTMSFTNETGKIEMS